MSNELQEALGASSVAPLIQKQIDSTLLEYQRRYSPLVRALPDRQWGSTNYYFNTRTARGAGGAVQDGGARPVTNSTYIQSNFQVRLFQQIGAVTGFAQVVTRDLVGDLKQLEIDGAMQGLLWDVETELVWGNDAARANGQYPGTSGLDTLVSSWSGTTQNAIDQAGATLALRHLDLLIDQVETNAAMPVGSNFMLVMSSTAQSKLAQLLTNQQRFMGNVEVAAGLIVPSYRDVPILKSSFLAPRSNAVGTVTSSTAASGGSLAAATYSYQVTAVVARFGEIAASTEVSQVTAGATSTVTLTVPAVTGPDGAGPILFKVWRSTSSGTETLLGIVDAFDTTGAAVTSIIDTGANLLTNSAGNTGPAAYVGTNAGQKPRATGVEDLYLIPRDPNFLVRPWTRNMTFIPLAATTSAPDTLPFAIVTDTCLAVRAPKYVGRLGRVSCVL